MTKPINLYMQSRIHDESSFNRVEQHTSKRKDNGKTKKHEIESLKKISTISISLFMGKKPRRIMR